MSRKTISFVSPCYNEEGNVEGFYDLVKEQLEKSGKYDYEIVFVNDGSKDKTIEKLKKIYEKDKKHVKVVNFLRNFGKEAAMLAGLKEATGDYVCTIDSDLQQEPCYAVEMANILEERDDIDMVAARPNNVKDPAMLAFFKKSFYKIINKMSNVPFYQGASDFRTFRKCIKDVIVSLPEHTRFSKGIFSWVGFNTHYIPYQADDRLTGTTKWSFLKLWKYAFEGILAFSTKPLELPFWGGLGLTGIGLLRTAVAAAKKDDSGKTNGLIALIGGLNMAATGIAGIYLSKTYVQSKGRPVYIAKSVLTNRK